MGAPVDSESLLHDLVEVGVGGRWTLVPSVGIDRARCSQK